MGIAGDGNHHHTAFDRRDYFLRGSRFPRIFPASRFAFQSDTAQLDWGGSAV